MSDGDDIRVQLARIEGKQDMTNERLETANRINDERHTAVKLHLTNIDTRLNGHGDRIGGIEKREVGREGERKGIATSTKVLWAGVTLLSGGIGAVIMRLSGAM